MTQMRKPPLRILLELRPALGGHAGIPQATRLLFRSLALLDDVRIEGLLQTQERVLSRGTRTADIQDKVERLALAGYVKHEPHCVAPSGVCVCGLHLAFPYLILETPCR